MPLPAQSPLSPRGSGRNVSERSYRYISSAIMPGLLRMLYERKTTAMRPLKHTRPFVLGIVAAATLALTLLGCGRSVLPEAVGPVIPDGGGVDGGALLVGLTIAPAEIQLALGDELQMLATAMYDDGSTVDVTELSAWSSSDPSTVGISPTGEALAIAGGDAEITATYEDFSVSALIAVIDESTITGIEFVPPS